MRVIDADALKDRLDYCVKEGMGSTIAFTFKHMVDDAPTIEPKRGEGVNEHEDGHGSWVGTCTQCNKENRVDNFCPHGGADMRGKDDEASD